MVDGVDCQADGCEQDRSGSTRPPGPSTGTSSAPTATPGATSATAPGSSRPTRPLYKNIKVGKSVKLQLRFEVYNLFNTVNFLGGSLTNSDYGAQNVVVLSADQTTIVSAMPAGNFGQLTAARDPRTMQLGIRLAF